MKSLVELRKMVISELLLLADLRRIPSRDLLLSVEYEVETSIDVDGGYCFSDLSDLYEYVANVLREQTDTEIFECDVFKKIDCIQISMNFEEEIFALLRYTRKSDTEFTETVLI